MKKLLYEVITCKCESMRYTAFSLRAGEKHGSGPGHSAAREFRGRLMIFLCLILAFVLSPAVHAAERVTVKVGYYENEVFQEGAREGVMKSGYAYEYYHKLSEYTGCKYEYVYG